MNKQPYKYRPPTISRIEHFEIEIDWLKYEINELIESRDNFELDLLERE